MIEMTAQIQPVYKNLLRVGFLDDRIQRDVPIPDLDKRVPLLAFADQPFDSRTASVAVVSGQHLAEPEIANLRPLGAPLIFRCLPDHYQVWKQGTLRPRFYRWLAPRELPEFFERHRNDLAPESIYRAKVWGRLEQSFQLDFVDAGLLPMVEQEAGQKLTELVERLVLKTKNNIGWQNISSADGRWLLKSLFWLLAAKILKDKFVPGFRRLELTNLEEVYFRLAKHYNSDDPRPVPISSRNKHEALVSAAIEIKTFAHCGAVSTEALAYLYESALIDQTVRQKLGIHSTPTWLVDYIVGRIRPWVENDIAVDERRVFEPACGHAGFLIAAMRLLSELLPANWHQSRKAYLRDRLRGIEVDSFALEIARLSLTLTDVPNPNGWKLVEGNMFRGESFENWAKRATIALGNPPFENFDVGERRKGWLPNKAAETFRRVIEYLPPGGVFGFVLPQTFLRARQANDLRRLLLRDYEIDEISLFADKVFRYGEPESTVIIGRRLKQPPTRHSTIRYQRIREGQVEEFRRSYEPGSTVDVTWERLSQTENASLLVPDLNDVWDALEALPRFEEFADIGQGFSHKADDDPTMPANVIKESPIPVPRKGLIPGFARWEGKLMTHELPIVRWLNLHPDTILRPRSGTKMGEPQVLLNHARISRGAWRLIALIDEKGHPVKSRFNVVRPKLRNFSLLVLWAILNSPIGNAYAYCVSSKRDVLSGDIQEMPVPDLTKNDLGMLEQAVSDYLKEARTITKTGGSNPRSKHSKINARQMPLLPLFLNGDPDNKSLTVEASNEHLKFLHWRIDAEVLRLYNLPASLERKVLDLFRGIRRRGVPFEQLEYFPEGFSELERLQDLLAITVDWPKTNRRRAKLMDLEEAGRLTHAQASELANLQRLADASVSLTMQPDTTEIDRAVESLKRRGLWME